MSSGEKKARESAGARPRLDPNPTWDDTKNPDAVTPEPNKNCLQGNSERFTAIITESFQTLELKFEDILKIQGEHRQKLYQEYSLQMKTLKRKISEDAAEVKKHAKKKKKKLTVSNIFKEQQKFIHQFLGIQKKRMEEFKDLCEQYLEKLVILRDSRGDSLIEELRRLIATLKIKLLMLNCQKENAAGQLSLLDLLFS
ncbi:X-linked lymphocyte-regulated protein 3C-like [Microtus oregoni]|uniref:X-linked lymphocyte-regulated protein 3C-like n=1 Tax=Microtus oregoni TaxID=111838 RepID=UPI001BB1A90D|nr:X-linked lymphocyte-regulated protein 3C-like [Microtus oregoni]